MLPQQAGATGRRHRRRPSDGLLAAGTALVTFAVFIASTMGRLVAAMGAYKNWWGGTTYGARFASDLVPLFVLLGALGWRALLDRNEAGGRTRLRRRLEATAFAAALGSG